MSDGNRREGSSSLLGRMASTVASEMASFAADALGTTSLIAKPDTGVAGRSELTPPLINVTTLPLHLPLAASGFPRTPDDELNADGNLSPPTTTTTTFARVIVATVATAGPTVFWVLIASHMIAASSPAGDVVRAGLEDCIRQSLLDAHVDIDMIDRAADRHRDGVSTGGRSERDASRVSPPQHDRDALPPERQYYFYRNTVLLNWKSNIVPADSQHHLPEDGAQPVRAPEVSNWQSELELARHSRLLPELDDGGSCHSNHAANFDCHSRGDLFVRGAPNPLVAGTSTEATGGSTRVGPIWTHVCRANGREMTTSVRNPTLQKALEAAERRMEQAVTDTFFD